MKQKLMAALTAAAMTALSLPMTAAFADDAVSIPDSAFLQDKEKTGELTITKTGGREICVRIDKVSQESGYGDITYYNTTLKEDGKYTFTLDSCEYDFGGSMDYTSSFTVTVWDKEDSGVSYKQENLIVVDPGFTTDATCSRFDWTITSSEADTQNVIYDTAAATLLGSVWQGSTDISMQYVDYILGDVTGDGEIRSDDVFAALYYSAMHSAGYEDTEFAEIGVSQSENAAFNAADIDKDGDIDNMDVFYLLYYTALDGAGYEADWNTVQGKTS